MTRTTRSLHQAEALVRASESPAGYRVLRVPRRRMVAWRTTDPVRGGPIPMLGLLAPLTASEKMDGTAIRTDMNKETSDGA